MDMSRTGILLPQVSILSSGDGRINQINNKLINLSCGYISVCCLMSITVNRLIGIVFPLHYKVSVWIEPNFVVWICH